MFHAAEFVSPGFATVIANVQPLFAAILAHLFLGEKLGAKGKTGLILGLVGIIIIAWPRAGSEVAKSYLLGIAYIALAGIGVATGKVHRKARGGKVDALMAMGFQLLIGSLPLGFASLSTEDPFSI